MATEKKPAGFQWNASGWFASQLGATLWLLIMALLLAPANISVAGKVFALFAAPNIVGLGLWAMRGRIRPYPALQAFIAVFGVCAMAAIYVIEAAGLWRLVSGVKLNDSGVMGLDGTVSADLMKIAIGVTVPAVMIGFHRKHRRAQSQT